MVNYRKHLKWAKEKILYIVIAVFLISISYYFLFPYFLFDILFPEYKYIPVYANEGDAYFISGEYDKAIKSYNKSIRRSPYDSRTYFGRARAYEKLGEYEKAKKDREMAEKLAKRYLPLE